MKTVFLISVISSIVIAQQPFPTKERVLIAYMKVKPGTESLYLELAKTVVEKSRKEPGNLHYQLHQSTTNPQLFVFYERFKTEKDLQDHRNAPHLKEFLEKTKPMTMEFTLDQYAPLELHDGSNCENVGPFKGDGTPATLKILVGPDQTIRINRVDQNTDKTALFKHHKGNYFNRVGNVRPENSSNVWYDEVFDSTVSQIEFQESKLTLWYDTETYPVPRYYQCN